MGLGYIDLSSVILGTDNATFILMMNVLIINFSHQVTTSYHLTLKLKIIYMRNPIARNFFAGHCFLCEA